MVSGEDWGLAGAVWVEWRGGRSTVNQQWEEESP